jgi:hypothetical protein
MKKAISLIFALTSLPIWAMEAAPAPDQEMRTVNYAEEEFVFWRCKKAIKLCWTLTEATIGSRPKRLKICHDLLLPPPQLDPKDPPHFMLATFKDYIVQTSLKLCMSHQFQRADLRSLQKEFQTLGQTVFQEHGVMGAKIYWKRAQARLKDIKNPGLIPADIASYGFPLFNSLALDLKKCTELKEHLQSLNAKENEQPAQSVSMSTIRKLQQCCIVGRPCMEHDERAIAFRKAVFEQGPC